MLLQVASENAVDFVNLCVVVVVVACKAVAAWLNAGSHSLVLNKVLINVLNYLWQNIFACGANFAIPKDVVVAWLGLVVI